MVKPSSIVLSLAASATAAPTCTWSSWKNVKNLFVLYDTTEVIAILATNTDIYQR
jgi:hypothetical protein